MKIAVVPEPSERCATMIGPSGSLAPAFTAAMAGSFHFAILPRKMPERTSGVSFSPSMGAL